MKASLRILLIGVMIVAFAVSLYSQNKKHDKHHDKAVHWSYSGETGPLHWGELSPEFAGCSKGTSQTPIDLKTGYKTNLDKLQNSFYAQDMRIINNGHTIQINFGAGNSSVIDGIKFALLQFHFHTPSEHTVNGKHYPMEMHLVHKNDKGELGVIGVFFKEGKENSELQKIIDNFPGEIGKETTVKSVKINAADFLPADKNYYHYFGSLTTPPCSEGVSWVVIKAPLEASKKQIEQFEKIMHENNRPVLPLNKRFLLESD